MSVYAYEYDDDGARECEGEGESVAAAQELALKGARAALEGGLGESSFESSFESDGEQMAAGKPKKRPSKLSTALTVVLPMVSAGGKVAADVANKQPLQNIRQDINNLNDVAQGVSSRRRRDHPDKTKGPKPPGPPPPPIPPQGTFVTHQVRGVKGDLPLDYGPGLPAVNVAGGGQKEFESEWESSRSGDPTVALEHLGRAAAEAESEEELEAFAAAMAPVAAALSPSIAPQIMRAVPALAGGLAGVARALGADAATRQHVRALPTVVRRTANELARRAAQGQPVTPRAAVRSLARQTARTLAARGLSSCAQGGGAFERAGDETLAQSLDGEAMDFDSIREAWSAIPPHIKQQLFSYARQTWDTRGVNLTYLVALAYSFMRGGMATVPALRTAALQLRIPPRPQSQPRGMSPTQVGQYHRRQLQRGHQPGQSPQMRSRLQRESEAEAEAEARLLEPWPEHFRRDGGQTDEADYMSRQRGQGNVLTKCQEMLTEGQFNNLNNLAVQKANREGHVKGKSRGKRDIHQQGLTRKKDAELRAACRLVVNGSGYQAAVDYLNK